MPRQTILKAFAFLSPMEEWATKDPVVVENTTNDNNTNNNNDDEDFFGAGIADATSPDTTYNLRSHYLPLTSSRSIFQVFTPFVAMSDDFGAISEEDLSLFHLASTLDFTLSLNLRFHGDTNRKSQKMFEKLDNIRFLRELKLSERVSGEDMKQVAGLHFLTSLELFDIRQIPDDALSHLHGLVNLEKITFRNWQRLTSKGLQQVPLIAPNLRELNIDRITKLSEEAFRGFGDHPSFVKSFRSLTVDNNYCSNSEACWFNDKLIENDLIKLVNLEKFVIIRTSYDFGEEDLIDIIKNCTKLTHLEIGHTLQIRVTTRVIKLIGKNLGEHLHTLILDVTNYGFDPELALRYLARYFKNLHYLNIGPHIGNIVDHFKKFTCLSQLTAFYDTHLRTKEQVDAFFEAFRSDSDETGFFAERKKILGGDVMTYKDEETDDEDQ